ncbi:disulfide bond formation protein B [Pseudomonas sp. MAFF212428]|uniref:Disulfide bond formation protein B n=1 Tax=Pseudomonas brassicae TaxID=2708063 RepID=A0A6B3NTP9_9PSED|nr:disulfide bond formation protein B [Pseudomonas brassicae]NER62158.1 disulfide bond formation protein B [Pseudomonas brassicae]NER64441.1 disulfide bond formation protein B [Pseudomonas brassicae]
MRLACLRSLFSLAFVASVLILAGAFYLEFAKGLVPCPLCQSQRMLLGTFAAVCLIARLRVTGQAGARRYAAVALLLALAGGLLAVRQIWLQGQAVVASVPCPRPLGVLIEQGAYSDVLQALVLGSVECASIHWSFLDLSLPEWSLLAFLVLAALALARLLQGSPLRASKSLKP